MRKHVVTVAASLLLAQFSNGAFAQQAAPAAWSGWARCQITVQGPGYTDQQTHTWTIGGGAPTAQGAFQIYAGTWSVVGGGSLSRTQGTQTLMAQWATNGPNISAPIAVFVRASDHRMFIQARHAQLRSAAAIQGYQQITIAGKPQTPGKIAAEAFEWAFPVIAVSAPVPPDRNATATGSSNPPVSGSVGPMQPAGSQGTASCTWQFGQGSAAPAPPPTLTAQAIPTPGNPTTTTPPANNPPGTTPPTNPPVSTTPPTSGARLVSVSPTTVEQGAIGTSVTLTGQGTHWLQTRPTVVVAPDIGVPIRNTQATSDTELLAQFDVQYAAVTGSRTITVTAGSEVVSLPNAFTVTARARPELVSVTPNRAKQGERNLTVRLTGRNTRWAQGATRVQIGRPVDGSQPGTTPPMPGVTVLSTTVHSPTSASAVLNVEANAVVGAYWFQVYDAAPSDWLNIVDGFTVAAGDTPPGSGVPPGTDATQAPLVARHPANMGESTPQTESVDAAPTAPGTSQWWKIVAEDRSASTNPLLQFTASITGGPADRIYQIDLVEETSAGLVNRGMSANVNAPVSSGRWSNVSGSDDGKTFFVVVRHVSGAPSADRYRLTMAWGGSQPGGASAATARLVSVAPTSIEQGVSASDMITMTGEGTHWQQGTTTVNFGPGVTIQGGVRVLSPTSLTTHVSLGYADASGPRAISVTTGNEIVSLPNALTIVAREQPVITQISPNSAPAGAQNVTVTFTGRGTRWEQGKTGLILNNAAGITQASALSVTSPTSMMVSLNIAAFAAPGPREITVLNAGVVVGSDIIRIADAFTVNPPAPADVQRIVSVTPNTAEQGAMGYKVTLNGNLTHWRNGTPAVSFGPGITILGQPQAVSADRMSVLLQVTYAAAPGPRAVTVTTGTEVVSLANALTIAARTEPRIESISPNTAPAGSQNVPVVFVGSGTRWEQGQTRIHFSGTGISVVGDPAVTSPTRMTATFSIDPTSTPGARDLTVLNGGPVIGAPIPDDTPLSIASDVLLAPGGFTVSSAGLVAVPINPGILPTPVICTLRGPGSAQTNNVTPKTARLFWTPVAGATGYSVSRRDLGVLTPTPLNPAIGYFYDRRMAPHPMSYVYTITAHYPQGCGSTDFTLNTQPPSTPPVYNETGSGVGSVRLRWGFVYTNDVGQSRDSDGVLITGPALPPTGRDVRHFSPSSASGSTVISGIPAGSRTWIVKAYWDTTYGRVMDNTGKSITVTVP